jgi:uncharacterized protein (TIGR00299 family) protein
MKIAYIDCSAGISGDMCLGALLDAGVDLSAIKKGLKKLPIKNYNLSFKKVLRCGISATKVDVILKTNTGRQKAKGIKWKDVEKIIKNSSLPDRIKNKGLHIFKRLFESEARVHGKAFDKIHLHELGGVDCIVDIFGTLIGFDILGIEKIYASPVNLGGGSIKTSHAVLSVPAPATIELLRGCPVYLSNIALEMTTPTGAAIVTGLKSNFSSLPEITVKKIGYGAGSRDITTMPNVLRIITGEEHKMPEHGSLDDIVTIIETNIDDMNPQIYEDIVSKLFKAGAMDVFLENIIMKKGRPAVKLTVIIKEQDMEKMADILFKETTTIGLRFYRAHRKILHREIKKVKTKYGNVRIKISRLKDRIVNISPEYDDLKAISKRVKLPIKKISEDTLHLFRQ